MRREEFTQWIEEAIRDIDPSTGYDFLDTQNAIILLSQFYD